MEAWHLFLLILLGVPIVWAIAATIGATSLQKKFAQLGVLVGMSKADIISKVGPPSSVSDIESGKSVLQWQTTGYHIALVFDGEICGGVAHEYSS